MTGGFIAALIAIIGVLGAGMAHLLKKAGKRDEQWDRAVDQLNRRDEAEAAAKDARELAGEQSDAEVQDQIDKRTDEWK